MNHKLANVMNMGKGNGNTTKLLFSLKVIGILHQEKRGQVYIIVMEHFDDILFNKSGLANKQHTYQSICLILSTFCYFFIHMEELTKSLLRSVTIKCPYKTNADFIGPEGQVLIIHSW